jgi:hypothetical protein
MNDEPEEQSDYPSSLVERWGCVSVAFLGLALVGIVYLSCVIVIELWPGSGRPDMPGLPLSLLVGSVWTAVSLLLAWRLRQ